MWQLPNSDDRFFSTSERKQVEVLFEAILPADDTSPGATDANAVEYVDRFLALDESFYYEIKSWKSLYRDGLISLNTACEQLFARPISELKTDEATQLLDQLSKGTLQNMPVGFNQRGLFSTLRNHCIEGCYSDPRWGGNKASIVWSWIGYLKPPQEFKRNSTGKLEEVS